MSAISAAFQRTENFRLETDIETATQRMDSFAQLRADMLAEADAANSHELQRALRSVANDLADFVHDFVMPEIGGAVEQLEERVKEV
jgi:hypothetical protein